MITPEVLTGLSTEHLVTLSGNHRLQFNATKAFLAMQKDAMNAGFKLQPASSFRDFTRQQTIWNEKFRGQRPVLDDNSQPLDISKMDDGELCEAILRWSALPGASRHHWGTDLDVYDPFLLPRDKTLLLEPWEYENGGYFEPLTHWLTENMSRYDFYRPFTRHDAGVAYEPWHISYWPISHEAEHQFNEQILLNAWQDRDIAGINWLKTNLTYVFDKYIRASPDN
ncbi:M15 family metallopeptidase [Xenorhabdus szentirmaii]|uniref:M15 family metallopeptidase n=1 Tax=Xenorhabdus szentirmaii TaxID=290112 RepID=UPI0019CBBFB3|nr:MULTISPECIES: M15 family metallopeptidase [unclassified Xenorhabdus]MBD2791701.1 M15 family metallopeptidase [Xenorhabdus sp. CUL]MBD2824621.1 M15 family metallopeptidase [Xenorhabdus sp. 5]